MDNLITTGIQDGLQMARPLSAGPAGSSSSQDLSFKDMIKSFLGQVNTLQSQADEKMKAFAAGEIQNVHEVLVAAEKATLALNLAVQLRDRIVDAYNTVLQMQV